MRNHNSRLDKLEAAQSVTTKKKYICLIDAREDKASKVFDVGNYGGGGEVLHFATRAELDSFAARPDVDLTILEIVYASKKTQEI